MWLHESWEDRDEEEVVDKRLPEEWEDEDGDEEEVVEKLLPEGWEDRIEMKRKQ